MIATPLRLLLIALSITCVVRMPAQQLINQRQITQLEQAKRPADPWPRGDGHVLIAEPGSPLSQKGYYEPGGSFSPSPGSFGVAIWVIDRVGMLIQTSDDIPMEKIGQSYGFLPGASIPGISTTTPYYRCSWNYVAEGRWELSVQDESADDYSLELVIRSVGPAGGPLTSVVWDSTRLLLNNRWVVEFNDQPKRISIGEEENGALRSALPNKQQVLNANGWAFARLGIPGAGTIVKFRDSKPQFKSALTYEKTIEGFGLQLPDKQFEQSLQAQISSLMMGYIGRQTGPGEPVNYPLAWERDGAYSLVAMAKSGHLTTARELSIYFAENDFFGGFGAEGDAPGSAIHALTEVAFLLNDPAYFQWLWPHIERKLGLIDEMMNARANVYKNFLGPLAPHIQDDVKRRQWICKPVEDGLIVGAMDNHFPVLYINSISYRGLIQAARIASKLGKNDVAEQCRAKAKQIQSAWNNGFGKKKYDNERNFMISIWPSWITNKENALFREKIAAKHVEEWGDGSEPKERPLWTYFTVAEAHQWLFLDRPDRTWETLKYFWKNQSSPGLFSYWEGNGEENTFRQWEQYRGWLKPKYVTPHYWTASEMTLLQLDMLVYVDESKDEYQLVLGAGIPPEWLSSPMSVKEFRTKAGTVTWEYKDNSMKVILKGAGKKYAIVAGASFQKAGTKVQVSYR